MKNIHRKEKIPGQFVSLDKGFLNDNRLSWKAKGILAYLLSKPDDWKVIQQELQKASNDGRTAVSNGIRELMSLGYIAKEEVREKGRFAEYIYKVYEEPTAGEQSAVN